MNLLVFIKKFDWVLVLLVMIVWSLGLAAFYGVGSHYQQIIIRQITIGVLGLALLLAVSLFDYRILKNYSIASIFLYAVSIGLLLLALASHQIRGTSSWVSLGRYQFQPSEFAKLALLVLLAKYFSQKHVEIYRSHHILASAVYAAVPAALTLIQPDLGSTLIFIGLWLAMLIFAGIKRRHLLTIIIFGLTAASLAWFWAFKPYQKDRIISFLNPYIAPRGIGYNAIRAQTTLGSGRIFGSLLGGSKQKLAVVVPEPYTDFALAAYGQKFGFVGITVLLGLILAIMLRIGSIVLRTGNNFPKLFGLGLMTIIFIHVFINAGMNLGLLPITGIPFSFLSYGGSHLLTLMVGLGLVESIRIRG